MVAETWFCTESGGTDIRHNAIVRWNRKAKKFKTLNILDGSWCEPCTEAYGDKYYSGVAYGIPTPPKQENDSGT